MITVVTTCTEQQAIATPIQARLNRRQFLWLTGGAMLLSACTPFVASAPVAPAAEPSTGETVGEPQSGGTLRLAFGGQVTNLDPHRGFTLPDFTVAQALYEALLGWTPVIRPTRFILGWRKHGRVVKMAPFGPLRCARVCNLPTARH